jgi:hypothetical protein
VAECEHTRRVRKCNYKLVVLTNLPACLQYTDLASHPCHIQNLQPGLGRLLVKVGDRQDPYREARAVRTARTPILLVASSRFRHIHLSSESVHNPDHHQPRFSLMRPHDVRQLVYRRSKRILGLCQQRDESQGVAQQAHLCWDSWVDGFEVRMVRIA